MMRFNAAYKKRKGSGILLSVITAAFVSGLIGVSVARLHGVNFLGLASVNQGMQAQQIAASLAEQVRATSYDDLKKSDRDGVPGLTGFYQTIDVTENAATGVKSVEILVDSGNASNPDVKLKLERLRVSQTLYHGKGSNTDGAMTQKAVTDSLNELEDTFKKALEESKSETKHYVSSMFESAGGVPIGTVIGVLFNNPPDNSGTWLLLDGRTFDKDDFKELYALMGTNKLPDSQGRFLEGTVDSNVGVLKEAGLPNITGTFGADDRMGHHYSGAFAPGGGSDTGSQRSEYGFYFSFDASRSSSIYGNSTTVQPNSITVKYYVKAKNQTSVVASDNSIASFYLKVTSVEHVGVRVALSDGTVFVVPPGGITETFRVKSYLTYQVILENEANYICDGLLLGETDGKCMSNIEIIPKNAVYVNDDPSE